MVQSVIRITDSKLQEEKKVTHTLFKTRTTKMADTKIYVNADRLMMTDDYANT